MQATSTKPKVRVFQRYDNPEKIILVPDFPIVIIGPLYKEYYREELGFYGNIATDVDIPTVPEGTLDSDSIIVEIAQKDGTIRELSLANGDYSISGQTISIVAGLNTRGDILVSWRDRRSDYTDRFLTLTSVDQINREWGMGDNAPVAVSDKNPLIFAAKIAMNASGDKVIYCLNCDMTQSAFENALGLIKRERLPYFIVPLSNEYWVHTKMKNFVEECEQPDVGYETMAVVAWDFDSTPELVSSDSGYVETGSETILKDDNFNFIFEGVVAGDTLVIGNDVYEITNVSDHEVTIGANLTVGTDIVYVIKSHELDEEEMSIHIYALSQANKHKRLIRVFPDELHFALDGVTSADGYLPSYYVSAWLAGRHAALTPSDSLTNEIVDIVDDIKHSSNYFVESQIERIAQGGNTIVVQDYKGSACYIRREFSADIDTLEKAEPNITMQADILAKTLRKALRPELGRKNKMSEENYKKVLHRLSDICTRVIATLSDDRMQYIGKKTLVKWIKRDPNRKDGVIVCISLDSYYTLNNIDVFIYI